MFLAGGPFGLGPLELFLIVVVLLLVFGVSKIADLGGSLGTGIREFRKNIKDDSPEPTAAGATETAPQLAVASQTPPAAAPPVASTAPASVSTTAASPAETVSTIKCPTCGTLNPAGSRHCNQCGASLAAPVS